MTENPYESPAEVAPQTAEAPRASTVPRVSLPGSHLTVTLLGLAGGVAVAAAYMGMSSLNPFIAPGLCMLVACGVCVVLLRGLKMSLGKRLVLTLVLTIASYVLFIPVCTACGLAAASVGLSEMYGPNDLGLTLAVLFASVLVLNLVFAIALARLN